MTIGEHMRAAREKRRISRAKLSRMSGVHYQTIQIAENNRSYTNIMNIVSLADALGMSIDEYIGREVPNDDLDATD